MRTPAAWYPGARALTRTVIAHLGPTNSGKTHAALEAMKAAKGHALYCGPLRLLACEVADRLSTAGVACSLLTGQEVREAPGARHSACTVEMAAVGSAPGCKVYEVAVLDEVQLLGDASRGWAWTRALLGLPALQLHVCGDPGALPLLRQLVTECGDVLQVVSYERLSPLRVSAQPLSSLRALQPGDCLVAFSRKAVHGLQQEVVRRSSHAACLVYGALPPEARRQQAALFNTPGSRYGVLVASDAIGMGLNLKIRRVIFASMRKFDGKYLRPLTPSEVRQIAGRAGRYMHGMQASKGACSSTAACGVLSLTPPSTSTFQDSASAACNWEQPGCQQQGGQQGGQQGRQQQGQQQQGQQGQVLGMAVNCPGHLHPTPDTGPTMQAHQPPHSPCDASSNAPSDGQSSSGAGGAAVAEHAALLQQLSAAVGSPSPLSAAHLYPGLSRGGVEASGGGPPPPLASNASPSPRDMGAGGTAAGAHPANHPPTSFPPASPAAAAGFRDQILLVEGGGQERG
ncbi:P-loop containing nucleoside triphosphate hydrolase protein, partial [Haematococcus lacustris]